MMEAEPLLGVTVLESTGLWIDPRSERLIRRPPKRVSGPILAFSLTPKQTGDRMSTSLDQLKTTLSNLPAPEREELAEYLLHSLGGKDDSGNATWRSFLQGMGSVLEFFPPPERLNAWRTTQDVSLDDWPTTMRSLLAETFQDKPQQGSAT
jgi:hypothetical protein